MENAVEAQGMIVAGLALQRLLQQWVCFTGRLVAAGECCGLKLGAKSLVLCLPALWHVQFRVSALTAMSSQPSIKPHLTKKGSGTAEAGKPPAALDHTLILFTCSA
jgi:hypothetical protein